MALQPETIDAIASAGAAVSGGKLTFRDLGFSLLENANAVLAELAYFREQLPNAASVIAAVPGGTPSSLGIASNAIQLTGSEVAAIARTITESIQAVLNELAAISAIIASNQLLADSSIVQGGAGQAGYVIRTGDNLYSTVTYNITAVVDPTVDSDVLQGFDKGSIWINTVNNTVWCCADPSMGAAVWRLTAKKKKTELMFFAVPEPIAIP